MKRYLILCLLLLLVSLRLAAVWPVMRLPERALVVDSNDYIDLARSLLVTGQYGDPHRPGLDLLRPPIYPLALAGGLVIGQDELRWVSLGQVFISFLIAVLLAWKCAITVLASAWKINLAFLNRSSARNTPLCVKRRVGV